jgi:hypothetical protein
VLASRGWIHAWRVVSEITGARGPFVIVNFVGRKARSARGSPVVLPPEVLSLARGPADAHGPCVSERRQSGRGIGSETPGCVRVCPERGTVRWRPPAAPRRSYSSDLEQ